MYNNAVISTEIEILSLIHPDIKVPRQALIEQPKNQLCYSEILKVFSEKKKFLHALHLHKCNYTSAFMF